MNLRATSFAKTGFGSIVVAVLVTAGSVSAEPTDERSFRVVGQLADDRPRVRSFATERILRLAEQAGPEERQRLIQSLLRAGLTTDLETQLATQSLCDRVIEIGHRRDVQYLMAGTDSKPVGPELLDAWDVFSSLAGDDADARRTFSRAALHAGPTLPWSSIETPIELIGHLGCAASRHPRCHQPESEWVYHRLYRNASSGGDLLIADAASRVMGRLVEATVRENWYGWTIEQRLAILLLYHRDSATLRLCDEIIRTRDPMPRDWAAAMIAIRRIEWHRGWIGCDPDRPLDSDHPQWRTRIIAIRKATSDRRVLTIHPRDWQAAAAPVGRSTPPGNKTVDPFFQTDPIRTRVQDVAVWVLLDRQELDPREYGMRQLRADPIWGVSRDSLGFSTQWERDRAIEKTVP